VGSRKYSGFKEAHSVGWVSSRKAGRQRRDRELITATVQSEQRRHDTCNSLAARQRGRVCGSNAAAAIGLASDG